MNKIQITEANLKQASLIKSLVRLPWLKKIRHLLLTVWGVFCCVCLLVSSIMVLWTFFPHSSWRETSLFYNCESLSKITKLMRLDTNHEEQRQLWQRFQLCSSCCVLCYSLSVRWPQRHCRTVAGWLSCCFVLGSSWPGVGDSSCTDVQGSLQAAFGFSGNFKLGVKGTYHISRLLIMRESLFPSTDKESWCLC